MAGIEWDDISSFERNPKLDMSVGDEVEGTFNGDGDFVPKKALEQAGAKFPRDSYVFTIETKDGAREFWQGTKNYSIMNQLKTLRDSNGNTLKGLKVLIKRVSDKMNGTNYEISKA